jgi:GT2 family glycosyltransferase
MRRVVVPSADSRIRPGPTPTFAIVIAAYQAAETIGAAVASALAQTAPADEVIVVDDGSTDDIAGALIPYRDRITLIRKKNGGGASARNTGLREASADFVAVLDADDTYDPRRLEALAELAAERPDLDIITTDAYFVVNGERVGRFNRDNPFDVLDQRRAILWSCFIGGWPAIRRLRALECGGFDEALRIAYDWDCWLRLIFAGAKAGLVDEPLLDYHVRADSLSANRAKSLRERVTLLEKAVRNPQVQPDERRAAADALRHHRRRAALAEAQMCMAAPTGHTRRALVRLGCERGVPIRTRGRILAAAAVPRMGTRILAEQTTRLSPSSVQEAEPPAD